MLTKKQHELLAYIEGYLFEKNITPSYDEMKDALVLKSKSGVHRMIHALVERGYIEQRPYRARAIRIIRGSDNALRETVTDENLRDSLSKEIARSELLFAENEALRERINELEATLKNVRAGYFGK